VIRLKPEVIRGEFTTKSISATFGPPYNNGDILCVSGGNATPCEFAITAPGGGWAKYWMTPAEVAALIDILTEVLTLRPAEPEVPSAN
jgi:hypothetical protein